MQSVALGGLTLELTGSGTQLGLMVAAEFLPLLFFGAWGGAVADRFNKRRILIYTQIAFGVLAGALALIVFAQAQELWMIYLFALGLGTVRIFDNPVRQSFVSEMVDQVHLKSAVSLNSTGNNLARAVGPSIGGVLIAAFGLAFCFLVNALTYLVVIVMLCRMRESELNPAAPVGKERGRVMEGLLYVRSNPLIRDVLILVAVIGTFAYEFQVSLPILAEQTFHAGASGYAALMTFFGLGAAVGGIFAAGRHNVAPVNLSFFGFLFGVSLLGTALAPSIHAALLGMFLVGVCSINLTSIANTMIQLESEPSMRGRVMSLWGLAFVGSTPVGGPIIGFIGEHLGARWGIAVGGIVALLAFAVFSAIGRANAKREISDSVRIESEEERIASVRVE